MLSPVTEGANVPPVAFDWIQLAAAVGACQGLVLAGALIAQRLNRVANRVLAALMVAFTIYLLSVVYCSSGLARAYPRFFGISYPLPWVFGPLVYVYTVAASDRSWHLRWTTTLHFATAIAVVITTLPTYLMRGSEKLALLERLRVGDLPALLTTTDPLKYLSGAAYSLMTVVYLREHGQRIRNSYSNTERVNLRWLLVLAAAAGAIWLFAISIRVLNVVRPLVRPRGDLVAVAIALLVYAIGYFALRQPEIFRFDDSASGT